MRRLTLAILLIGLIAAPASAAKKKKVKGQPTEADLQAEKIDPDTWFDTAATRWHEMTDDCPNDCKACQTEVTRNLQILQKINYESRHQGFSTAKHVTCALAGLAFLAEGSTLEKGTYKDDLKKCVDRVTTNIIKDSARRLSWGTVYGAILLAEVQQKNPTDDRKKKLQEVYDLLKRTRQATGGWIHMFGYEIVAFTAITHFAIARIESCGIEVEASLKKKMMGYYDDAVAEDGTILYSIKKCRLDRKPTDAYNKWKRQVEGIPMFYHAAHKRPWSAARNGGALLVLQDWKQQQRECFVRAKKHFEAEMREVVFGWGSTQLGMLSSGWAAYREGGKTWTRYRDEIVSLKDVPRPNGWSRYRLYHDEAVRALLLLAPKENLSFLKAAK